jgi:hypothetical protein
MQKKVLTSVKVSEDQFTEMKIKMISTKFSLQKLVDRSIYLYLNDEDFRKKIHDLNYLEF